jgi:hypothetical protein
LPSFKQNFEFITSLREGDGKVAPINFWDFFVGVGGDSKTNDLTKNPKIYRTTCQRPTAF